jgi:hypothetical protein
MCSRSAWHELGVLFLTQETPTPNEAAATGARKSTKILSFVFRTQGAEKGVVAVALPPD